MKKLVLRIILITIIIVTASPVFAVEREPLTDEKVCEYATKINERFEEQRDDPLYRYFNTSEIVEFTCDSESKKISYTDYRGDTYDVYFTITGNDISFSRTSTFNSSTEYDTNSIGSVVEDEFNSLLIPILDDYYGLSVVDMTAYNIFSFRDIFNEDDHFIEQDDYISNPVEAIKEKLLIEPRSPEGRNIEFVQKVIEETAESLTVTSSIILKLDDDLSAYEGCAQRYMSELDEEIKKMLEEFTHGYFDITEESADIVIKLKPGEIIKLDGAIGISMIGDNVIKSTVEDSYILIEATEEGTVIGKIDYGYTDASYYLIVSSSYEESDIKYNDSYYTKIEAGTEGKFREPEEDFGETVENEDTGSKLYIPIAMLILLTYPFIKILEKKF